jgi:hypothetical protein
MLLVDLQNSSMSGKNNKTNEEHGVMLFYHRVEMLEVIFEYSLTMVNRTLTLTRTKSIADNYDFELTCSFLDIFRYTSCSLQSDFGTVSF